jgi:tetratricopeptide (TPR) repeat protein
VQEVMAGHDPFVGRSREMAVVGEALHGAVEGRGAVVVVGGEAGIGKTRLCHEAASRAADAGFTVVAAHCWVEGGAPALWPWQAVLRELGGERAAGLLAADAGRDSVGPERFARFVAVVDELAAASRAAPLLLVVEDVHAADAGALLLLRFVARSLGRARVVVLLSRRTGEPAAQAAARIMDEIEAEATTVVLGALDGQETRTVLSAHGWDALPDDVLAALVGLTRGNPLFLRRIAALGAVDRPDALPQGVHAAIVQALDRLDPGTRDRLRLAAVLGASPSVAEVAALAGTAPASVVEAVAEAARAGLVSSEGPDRFSFGHELIRSALEAELSAAARMDVHARAAAVVIGDRPAGPAERSARRAHHTLAAALRSGDDALVAVGACRAAARSMIANFAYEQADTLLTAALGVHEAPTLGPPPGGLLVEWAQAALLCGRLAEARRRFDRAAVALQSRDECEPVLLAEAALGLGGHWLAEHRAPVERARVLGLQQSALQRLPAGETALRCRLRARLAAEAVYDGEPVEPVLAALDAARDQGDSLVLSEALSLAHHALLSPDHVRMRLGLADELVAVASAGGHGVLALMGLCWRAVDLFLLGDHRAVRALEDLRARADALACRNIQYIVEVLDVMLLVRSGRLEEAEAAAERCFELGTDVGEVDALGYLGAHLLAIRWIQGRDTDLVDLAQEMATSATLTQDNFAFWATAAALAARAGQRGRARGILDQLTVGGLGRLPRSSTWLAGMMGLVEAAAEIGATEVAREACVYLAPHAGMPTMPSLAVVCLGSTERTLGVAALATGDLDAAIAHHERAVAANRGLVNRPLTAMAEAELAAALTRRDRPGDRARAASLLEHAVAEAEDMELDVRAPEWRKALAELTDGAGPSLDTGAGPTAIARGRGGAGPPTGVVCRHGRGWLLAVDGRRVFVADLVGMGYLATLLTHPGRPIAPLALATGGSEEPETSGYDVVDDAARAAYVARIEELHDDLAVAESDRDLGRIELVRAELDALVEHLGAAIGRGGRTRRFADEAERARTAVRKAIKRALDEIDAADPTIGQLLHTTVTTGSTCSYTPDPGNGITWSTRD